MKVSIRASKHQKTEMTVDQLKFASKCVVSYIEKPRKNYLVYYGCSATENFCCDVYRTKTQISAIVYFK